MQEVLRRVSQVGMQSGEVRPQHSFSIRSEDERRVVKQLLAQFRRLPSEEQKNFPALLNGLGKLQVGTGDFAGATATFETVAQTVADAPAKAEAHYNAYRAALEEKKWDDALAAIQQAATLDSQRFEPFPMERYQPKRLLGAGGFGAAFLCHDRFFNVEVVVKSLHEVALERNMKDVFREAHVLRDLHHATIISVRDCNYTDLTRMARPYIVMDYFPGVSLANFIQERGPISSEDLIVVARQVAAGIQAAHQKNVLHRDLKPDNILVRKEGSNWKVKIIDFGLALRKQTIETSMAVRSARDTVLSNSVAGTIKYAPPEQLGEMKGVKPGPYSDVYSFGKTCCYAMFRTTEPKDRHWKTVSDSIRADLKEILDQCREEELEHRFPSFEPVLKVLEAMQMRQRKVEGTGKNIELERKRRDQEEAERRQKQFEVGKKAELERKHGAEEDDDRVPGSGDDTWTGLTIHHEGEAKLGQFVRETLDRTHGKPTQDDRVAASEICNYYAIDKLRVKQIVAETKAQWQLTNPRQQPVTMDIAIPGEWSSRPATAKEGDGGTTDLDDEWAFECRTPATVTIDSTKLYQLKVEKQDLSNNELVGLANLKDMTSFQELSLHGFKRVTDSGLVHLKDLTNLKKLYLGDCQRITDAGLAHLKGLSTLQTLFLEGCEEFTDNGLAHLKGLTALSELILGECDQITDRGLNHLRQLPLRKLILTSAKQITARGLGHIKNVPLKELTLSDCEMIADSGMAQLKHFTSLQDLFLQGCNITNAGLIHLRRMEGLKSLYLNEESVTDDGLFHLRDLMSLQNLFLEECQISDVGLAHLRGNPLRELVLSSASEITDAGLINLNGLALVKLGLHWLDNITDDGLAHVLNYHLQRLELVCCERITDAGLCHLRHLPLRQLTLDSCDGITDAGLVHLRGLPLRTLRLEDCDGITEEAIEELSDALPNCDIVY